MIMDSYIPRRTRTIKDGFRSVIYPSRERVGKPCAIHSSKVTKGGDYLTEGSMYVLLCLGMALAASDFPSLGAYS